MAATHDHHSRPRQSLRLCPCRRVCLRRHRGLVSPRVLRLHYAAPVAAWKCLLAPWPVCDRPWGGQEGPAVLTSDWERPEPADSLSRTCGGSGSVFKALYRWIYFTYLKLRLPQPYLDDSPLHLILSSRFFFFGCFRRPGAESRGPLFQLDLFQIL